MPGYEARLLKLAPMDPTPAPVVARLEKVSKIYETTAARVVALEETSWEIGRGQAAALMGPSGCGKTHRPQSARRHGSSDRRRHHGRWRQRRHDDGTAA